MLRTLSWKPQPRNLACEVAPNGPSRGTRSPGLVGIGYCRDTDWREGLTGEHHGSRISVLSTKQRGRWCSRRSRQSAADSLDAMMRTEPQAAIAAISPVAPIRASAPGRIPRTICFEAHQTRSTIPFQEAADPPENHTFLALPCFGGVQHGGLANDIAPVEVCATDTPLAESSNDSTHPLPAQRVQPRPGEHRRWEWPAQTLGSKKAGPDSCQSSRKTRRSTLRSHSECSLQTASSRQSAGQ